MRDEHKIPPLFMPTWFTNKQTNRITEKQNEKI